MALIITEECINCALCDPECPTESITEGDPVYVIDQETCTECIGDYDEPKCAEVCPVDCCIPADEA